MRRLVCKSCSRNIDRRCRRELVSLARNQNFFRKSFFYINFFVFFFLIFSFPLSFKVVSKSHFISLHIFIWNGETICFISRTRRRHRHFLVLKSIQSWFLYPLRALTDVRFRFGKPILCVHYSTFVRLIWLWFEKSFYVYFILLSFFRFLFSFILSPFVDLLWVCEQLDSLSSHQIVSANAIHINRLWPCLLSKRMFSFWVQTKQCKKTIRTTSTAKKLLSELTFRFRRKCFSLDLDYSDSNNRCMNNNILFLANRHIKSSCT